MTAVERLRAAPRNHPRLTDALVALILFVAVMVGPPDEDPPARSVASVLVAALTCAALSQRRRWPALVLIATTAGTATAAILEDGRTPLAAATMVALYTVAVTTERRTTWIAWGATAGALALVSTVSESGGSILDTDVLVYLPWTAAAAALGDGLRNRRAYVAAVEERAVRAEQTRQEEARRQVAEERLRIARELHDVIAHRVAVVNVQAGVASHLLSSRPEAAKEALGHVREASRAILEELSDILNVLRQEGDSIEPTTPAPSMAGIDALVGSFAAAGLEVTWSVSGQPREIGPAPDLVAYRVLQEALTNAHKHGTGTAQVTLAYGSSSVALTVVNPIARSEFDRGVDRAHSGHGLIGMQERAAAVGGVLHAAAGADGQFRVEAVLPLAVAAR